MGGEEEGGWGYVHCAPEGGVREEERDAREGEVDHVGHWGSEGSWGAGAWKLALTSRA